MPNWTSLQLSPTHLGVFLLERTTGQPVTRLPVYAEAAWTARTPPPPPDNRFYELVESELRKLDEPCADEDACRSRTESAFAAALPQVLTSRERSRLLADEAAPASSSTKPSGNCSRAGSSRPSMISPRRSSTRPSSRR